MNTSAAEGLVQRLLSLPVFRSEWLLWLLLGLSFLSIAVMVERWFYYRGRKVNFEAVKSEFTKDLHKGDDDGAANCGQAQRHGVQRHPGRPAQLR